MRSGLTELRDDRSELWVADHHVQGNQQPERTEERDRRQIRVGRRFRQPPYRFCGLDLMQVGHYTTPVTTIQPYAGGELGDVTNVTAVMVLLN
jgi:hypothetical protein